jgi:Holliday junction resolvase-like predicted endonuclease
MIARNFTSRGLKGEIDRSGTTGQPLHSSVKTRTGAPVGVPEAAVTPEKRRHLSYIASQFLREYHAEHAPYRFDVLAIEASAGRRPVVRLHKGAFAA